MMCAIILHSKFTFTLVLQYSVLIPPLIENEGSILVCNLIAQKVEILR